MSLLTIIQSAADKIGVKRPTLVVSNNTPTIIQLLDYCNQSGDELMRSYDWQVLTKEKTFTSVASETQTDMVATDLDRFINETFWNRTQRRPFKGPLSPQEWQQIKATVVTPVREVFRQRGGDILIQPVPSAGDTFAYEYVSTQWRTDTNDTAIDSFSADTDKSLISENLITLGIVWRYKQARGLPWEGDYAIYETQVKLRAMRDAPKRTVDMANDAPYERMPVIGVPESNWNL